MFPDWVFKIISVVLLAAAMSTLDGLLVSISTITANDLVLNLAGGGDQSAPRMQLALKASHVVLVLIAVAAFLVNLKPPPLLGVFGQVGVYGLAVAAAPPLLLGVLYEKVPLALAWPGSALALAIHFLLFLAGDTLLPGTASGDNPDVRKPGRHGRDRGARDPPRHAAHRRNPQPSGSDLGNRLNLK
jgi:Na+(H+)/acetate symporter ActP